MLTGQYNTWTLWWPNTTLRTPNHIKVEAFCKFFKLSIFKLSFFKLSIRSLSLKKRMLYWSEKNRLFRMKIHCIMYVLWKNVGKSDDQYMDLKCEQFQKSVDEMINSCKKIKNPLVLMTRFVFILSLCERSLMLRFFFALFLFIMLRIEHLSKWLQLISKVISIASPKFLVSIL